MNVIPGEDSAFENEPTEGCNFGPPIPSPNFCPLGFFFPSVGFIHHPNSLFNVESSKVGITPPYFVRAFVPRDPSGIEVCVEIFNVLCWCQIFPPLFPFPCPEHLVRGLEVPEILRRFNLAELGVGLESQNIFLIFYALLLVSVLTNELGRVVISHLPKIMPLNEITIFLGRFPYAGT